MKNSKSNLFCGNSDIIFYDKNTAKRTNSKIKLFEIEISKYQDLVKDFINILTPSEISRAQNYYFEKDRNRFIICRALLKFVLKEQTGVDVTKIFIELDCNKKPYLPSHPHLFFNISHAGDYAVIAIDTHSIGVDIELLDRHLDIIEIMPHIFSIGEIGFVLNADDIKYAFYKFWTRKEAIVKAIGKGIDDNFLKIPSLDGFHLIDPELLGGINNLQVLSFDLGDQYIGAIACNYNKPDLKRLVIYPIPNI
jgi:4'-phosphopantetheinyl transferase